MSYGLAEQRQTGWQYPTTPRVLRPVDQPPVPVDWRDGFIKRLEASLAEQLDENERLEAEIERLKPLARRNKALEREARRLEREVQRLEHESGEFQERAVDVPHRPLACPISARAQQVEEQARHAPVTLLGRGVRVDWTTGEVFGPLGRVTFSPTELLLFRQLAQQAGRVVLCADLIAAVWTDPPRSRLALHRLKVNVIRMRTKFGKIGEVQIETIKHRGYRLVVESA